MKILPFVLIFLFCSTILCGDSLADLLDDGCGEGTTKDKCISTKPNSDDSKCCWVSKKSTSCEPFPKDQDAFDVIESTYKDGGMKVECGANFLNTISLISFVVTFLF